MRIWRNSRGDSHRRVRTPTVLQMESVECGAAALSIVLGYYGKRIALERLRVECGVSRDGSKASNLVKAARHLGMNANGYKREPHELLTMRLPLIVFWNFNHFLVVEGFGSGKVFLNDPASGPRTVTTQEFDESFTGVVLELEPGPDFVPGGDDPSILNALRRRLRGSHLSLFFLVLIGLLLVVPGMLVPVFTKVFIDDYLIAGHENWIRPLLLGMGFTAVARGVLSWLQGHVLNRLRTRLAIGMSGQFVWHVLRLPMTFFTQRSAGEVSNRIGINQRVAALMTGDVAEGVLAVMMVALYAFLMLLFDTVLTVVTVLIAMLNLAVLRMAARRRADGSLRAQIEGGKLAGVSVNGLRSIETLKAAGNEDDFFSKWAGHHAKALNAQQSLATSSLGLGMVPGWLGGISTVFILTYGGLMVMQGHLTIGVLVAFQSLAASFMAPFNRLMNLGGQVQEMAGAMKRLEDVLNHPLDSAHSPAASQTSTETGFDLPRLEGELELRNITFGFSPLDPPLIENFNLRLAPGMRVALVGSSGCGKSTLSKLVTGLYQPWSGEILFDGKPRTAINPQVLHQSLAMVDQDMVVFEGTLRDNLTLWDDSIPERQMVQAARDAHIHEVIAARAGGYESSVQEGGVNFSGGQLQRLEIARALVRNPAILVLDEATSALDPVSEQIVEGNLRRRGCTALIVAHRLSTIRDCDEIIVLERGKVVQRGTHESLKDIEGPYRLLMGEL